MKKLKKSLSLLLALVMVLSVMSVGVFADGDTFDSSADNPTITTATDLAAFRDAVNSGNSYSGKTVTLAADIDLNNVAWTPIGTSTNPFSGTFNGNGKTISNFKLSGEGKDNPIALFGYIKGTASESFNKDTALISFYDGSTYAVTLPVETIFGCEVKNLTVSGVTATTTADGWTAAAVAYCDYATVKNVTVTESTLNANAKVGGVVAFVPKSSAAFIDNCKTTDGVIVTASAGNHAAGILGRVYDNTSRVIISNSENKATINCAGVDGAGIAGQSKNTLFYNCTNHGAVTGKTRTAGITADSSGSVIIDCENHGTITSSGTEKIDSDYTAGIIAWSSPAVVVNCKNYGNVTAANRSGDVYVSGIVNSDKIEVGESIVLNCVNTGTLTNHAEGGEVYPISKVKDVRKTFAPANLDALNAALDANNKIVEVTNLTLPYDNCTITPAAQETLIFVNSPGYLTLDLSNVTTSSLEVNVSGTTISVTGNTVKNNLVLYIVGSGNNITYAAGNTLSLKQLIVQDDSGSSTVAVSAGLTELKLAGTGEVTATVAKNTTIDQVKFETDGGTYTLNNRGKISHTQSDSNQDANEHTVSTEASCTVTVNNYGTIEAKRNDSGDCSYAVLLHCTTATVNQYLGSKITAEAELSNYYKIHYGDSTNGSTNDYRETEVFGTITDMTLVVGSDNKLVYTFALNDAGKALSNPQVKLKIEGKDDYLEAKSEAEFNASDKTVYTVSENSGVYTLKVKIFAKYMNAKVSVELWDGDSQKAIESYSRSQYTVEGYDSYKTAQTGLTFGYSLVEYLGYYAGVTKDSKYSALYTAMVPYAQAAAAWR